MKNYIQPIVVLCCLTFLSWNAFAHGEDDHAKKPSSVSVAQKYFSTEASSNKYELLIRHEPIESNEDVHLTLFISEYASNKPIDNAKLKITSPEDSMLKFAVHAEGEGQYLIETEFPSDKVYSLVISINAVPGADLILIKNISVGKKLPIAKGEGKSSFSFSLQNVLIAFAALLMGVIIGALFRRRNTNRGKQIISTLLLVGYSSFPIQQSVAHEGEDHTQKNTGNNFPNAFMIPKETQFLFDIITDKVQSGAFTESTMLFGTIIPSSNGQAIVTTPQNGRISLLKVRVGEQVHAGQLLATIEQNVDAGTQVNLLTEKNNMAAEYEAAKRNLERLNSIQDIAARKDIDEANARFQKAKTNLELLSGTSGRTIAVYAPVKGVVGNFTMTTGSTVNQGQQLFTITDLATVYAEAQVFDRDADKIKEGIKFSVECANDDHKTSDVKLLSVGQEINATNQSQKVLFQLNNPEGAFKIGEFVNIRVFATQNRREIALPNSSITEINGKPVVFIKDAAELYSISYVQPGKNNGSHTVILKGVEEGERVAVNGSYQLKMIYLNQ